MSEDALRGRNFVVSAALAAIVQPGDLIKVTSDDDFSTAQPGIKQAEIQEVRNVLGSSIYLTAPLNDSYLGTSNASAAVVAAADFSVDGQLRFVSEHAASSTAIRGLNLLYCNRPHGRILTRRMTRAAVTLHNCFAPNFDVDIHQLLHSTSQTSYGVSLQNSTMFGRVRGAVLGGRHAVTGTGSTAEGGAGWHNRVSVVGVVSDATAVFDCHENHGSITFEDSVAISSEHLRDLAGDQIANPSGGFSLGARYNYAKNCQAHRTTQAVSTRSPGSDKTPIERLDVDGLHIVDGFSHGISIGATSMPVKRLAVRRMTGNMLRDTPGIALNLAGTIEAWDDFVDIRVDNARLFNTAAGASLPAVLAVDGFRVTGPNEEESDTGMHAVYPRGTITSVILRNGSAKRFYQLLRTDVSLDLLELTNVDSDDVFRHIFLNGTITIAHLKIRGGSYRNAYHANANTGIVQPGGDGTIGVLEVDGIEMDGGDPWLAGGIGIVSTLILGTAKTHASVSGFVRSPAAGMVEVLSGSLEHPRVIRGAGSPESVHAATIGTLFERTDGGTDTSLYVKSSGTGDTGWRAVTTGAP